MTTKRRGFREGTVDQRAPNTWRLRYRGGDGKRHAATVSGSRTDAQRELRRLLKTVDDGTHITPNTVTVAEFLDRWDRDWAANNISAKTRERYQELIRKQIRPHIGSLAIQKLRASHLAELYAKLLREGRDDGTGLSARTCGHVHRLLHRALGHAAQWDVIQMNVAKPSAPSPRSVDRIEIIRETEIRAVVAGLRGRILGLMATTLLATGLRRGELLALRWSDVDLDGAKLKVEQSLEQTKTGLKFKSPKPGMAAGQSPSPPRWSPSCRSTAGCSRSSGSPWESASYLRTHWCSRPGTGTPAPQML
jgi:Phage integrase, N-terminal SAM-like domain